MSQCIGVDSYGALGHHLLPRLLFNFSGYFIAAQTLTLLLLLLCGLLCSKIYITYSFFTVYRTTFTLKLFSFNFEPLLGPRTKSWRRHCCSMNHGHQTRNRLALCSIADKSYKLVSLRDHLLATGISWTLLNDLSLLQVKLKTYFCSALKYKPGIRHAIQMLLISESGSEKNKRCVFSLQ